MVVKCKIKAFGLVNEKPDVAMSHLQSFVFNGKGNFEIMICISESMLTLPGIAFPLMSAFMTAVKTKKNKH